jgi:hypothetical protein
MSFEDIKIIRQIPVINGFVQIPEVLEKNKTQVTLEELLAAYPSTVLSSLRAQTGGARLAGGKHGVQEWVEVCEQTVEDGSCDGAENVKGLLP